MFRTISGWLHNRMYSTLVFNQVWEDFDVDRRALQICPDDTILSITSGGCGVLNSALEGPKRVHSVDLNPTQNWLLELKVCAVQHLDYEDFWEFFGQGKSERIPELYRTRLRGYLSPHARRYWDKKIKLFKKGLYQSGRFGFALKALRQYVRFRCGSNTIDQFFYCTDPEEQRDYYERNIWKPWWGPLSRRLVSFPYCLLPFGASQGQATLVSSNPQFPYHLEMQIHHVLTTIPVQQNYFWQQAFLGRYLSTEHIPPYLKSINFRKLRSSISRIGFRTSTVTNFLAGMDDNSISKFNLSDIMDWMSIRELIALWRQVLRTAAPNSVIIWRSVTPTFSLPPGLEERLRFKDEEAHQLLRQERTGAYSRLFICTPLEALA